MEQIHSKCFETQICVIGVHLLFLVVTMLLGYNEKEKFRKAEKGRVEEKNSSNILLAVLQILQCGVAMVL